MASISSRCLCFSHSLDPIPRYRCSALNRRTSWHARCPNQRDHSESVSSPSPLTLESSRRYGTRDGPINATPASPDCSWPSLSRLLRPPRVPSPRRRPPLLAEPNHARIPQARWHAKCLNVPVNATPASSDCSWPRHSRSLQPSQDPPPRNRLSLLAKPDHARMPQARRHARCPEGTDHHDRSDL